MWAVVVTCSAFSKCGPRLAVRVNQYEMAANLAGLAAAEYMPWDLDQTSRVT